MKLIRNLSQLAKRAAAGPYMKVQYMTGSCESICVDSYLTSFPRSEYNHVAAVMNFEASVISTALARVDSSAIVWDVGADRGLYSTILGDKLDNGSIISFEPHPITSVKLRRITAYNNTPATVVSVALGDTHSRARSDGYQLVEAANGPIQIKPGDAMIAKRNLPSPDMLKIDTEGMELKVLQGLANLFESSPPSQILCEIHPKTSIPTGLSAKEIKELQSWLRDRLYEIEIIEEAHGQHYLWAERDV